jgi:hypothetical protein
MSAWHTVHVRVNDAATGQPTPVRIRFEAQGRSFAPFGRLNDFAEGPGAEFGGHLLLGEQKFYYIDGTCEIRLPPGEVTIEASKGPEYAPLRKVVTLAPGQISLRLAVERWTDLRPQGWYSGDTHVREIGPHAALLEGAAEDVAVVNLLAYQRPSLIDPSLSSLPNLLAFSGQAPALERPGHLVAVNTLNSHPVLGTLGLLNCHRVVYPLRFGDKRDDWSLADWCDQCHRKKTGLVVWAGGDWSGATENRLRSEALADLILGKIDAFEVIYFEDVELAALTDWYHLLGAGLRVPLVGGSLKDSNTTALGSVRTYAHLGAGKELNCAEWIEAVRAGRTFVTNGPLLTLSVDGQGPGAVLSVEPGRRLTLKAEAQSAVPFQKLELLVNGSVAASKEPSGDGLAATVETDWPAERSAWVAARCFDERQLEDGQCVYAQTSPVYVEVQGRPFHPDTAVLQSLVDSLDKTAGWVAGQARCEDQQRQHLLSLFSSARAQLLREKATDA